MSEGQASVKRIIAGLRYISIFILGEFHNRRTGHCTVDNSIITRMFRSDVINASHIGRKIRNIKTFGYIDLARRSRSGSHFAFAGPGFITRKATILLKTTLCIAIC